MAHFSASEHYKGKQCTNVYLHNYSEGLALHKLLVQANLAFEESGDEEWVYEDRYHHFTIIVDGKAVDFLLGAPQYEALIAFIKHVAAENMYYVDPKLRYVEGVL